MPSEESPPGADQQLGSVVEELKGQLKAKSRELADAREQQSATAEILRAISNSPTDLQRVFADVAVSAARLCDAPDASFSDVTPVRLPPGWFRLATSPALTGSAPVSKITGMVIVAAFAASAEARLPGATMTLTCRPTSSAASPGNRSFLPSAQRYSIAKFRPSS